MDLIFVSRDGLRTNEITKNRYLKQKQKTKKLLKIGEDWKPIMVCMLEE